MAFEIHLNLSKALAKMCFYTHPNKRFSFLGLHSKAIQKTHQAIWANDHYSHLDNNYLKKFS